VAKRELMVISFSDFPISGIRTISVDVCATVHGWLVGWLVGSPCAWTVANGWMRSRCRLAWGRSRPRIPRSIRWSPREEAFLWTGSANKKHGVWLPWATPHFASR